MLTRTVVVSGFDAKVCLLALLWCLNLRLKYAYSHCLSGFDAKVCLLALLWCLDLMLKYAYSHCCGVWI